MEMKMAIMIKGIEEDGSCALSESTPMGLGDLAELLSVLGFIPACELAAAPQPLAPMALTERITAYAIKQGQMDPEDWMDSQMSAIASFSHDAADLGAKTIVFIP
jgi:hypothetical protein